MVILVKVIKFIFVKNANALFVEIVEKCSVKARFGFLRIQDVLSVVLLNPKFLEKLDKCFLLSMG